MRKLLYHHYHQSVCRATVEFESKCLFCDQQDPCMKHMLFGSNRSRLPTFRLQQQPSARDITIPTRMVRWRFRWWIPLIVTIHTKIHPHQFERQNPKFAACIHDSIRFQIVDSLDQTRLDSYLDCQVAAQSALIRSHWQFHTLYNTLAVG